jgi:Tfp pilus assembly protein FimT
MKDRSRSKFSSRAGLTWLELLVILAILVVLASMGTVCGPPLESKPGQIQMLSNMKQLHLATQTLALDGFTTENTNWGWPGDRNETFSNWVASLAPYLSERDIRKLLSAPGRVVGARDPLASNSTAVLVYGVKEKSDGTVVFLSSANFTNTPQGGTALQPNSVPFGTNGFVVFRKGGDGSILRGKQVGQTNLIGTSVPLCR